jgi:ferredoxin
MRAAVDADVCAGHGACVGLAPRVFELTDDGYSLVRVAAVPAGLEAAVRTAVRQCPTTAITIAESQDDDV